MVVRIDVIATLSREKVYGHRPPISELFKSWFLLPLFTVLVRLGGLFYLS